MAGRHLSHLKFEDHLQESTYEYIILRSSIATPRLCIRLGCSPASDSSPHPLPCSSKLLRGRGVEDSLLAALVAANEAENSC
jgi:hypothetical protein